MASQSLPPPPSLLGRHRLLAPSAAVRVSPLCLGAMNFGDNWKSWMGECSKETSFAMLDYFYSQGGNFIDTAVNYQDGESEQWLGEWMEARGNRDEMVIATKFTGGQMTRAEGIIKSNLGGNGTKNLYTSIERSLKALKTSYIDLYYVHIWDYTTSIPELMTSLNTLVAARKVLYLGISDTPAWIVIKANDYARQHGLRPFSVYQGRWSAVERDFEREIIPMCIDQGMGLAPWGVLGGGYMATKEELENKTDGRKLAISKTGKEEGVVAVLDKIAKKHDTLKTSVALAYVMHKSPYVFPIVGGRKVEHLKGNIEALGLRLSEEDIAEIETGYPFEIGFPHNMLIGFANHMTVGPEDITFSQRHGYFDYVTGPKPIPPHQGPLDAQFKSIPKPPV